MAVIPHVAPKPQARRRHPAPGHLAVDGGEAIGNGHPDGPVKPGNGRAAAAAASVRTLLQVVGGRIARNRTHRNAGSLPNKVTKTMNEMARTAIAAFARRPMTAAWSRSAPAHETHLRTASRGSQRPVVRAATRAGPTGGGESRVDDGVHGGCDKAAPRVSRALQGEEGLWPATKTTNPGHESSRGKHDADANLVRKQPGWPCVLIPRVHNAPSASSAACLGKRK